MSNEKVQHERQAEEVKVVENGRSYNKRFHMGILMSYCTYERYRVLVIEYSGVSMRQFEGCSTCDGLLKCKGTPNGKTLSKRN